MTSRNCLWLWTILPWAAVLGCSSGEPTDIGATGHVVEVDVVGVRRGEIGDHLELIGTLIPVHATTIVSDVEGTIASFGKAERSVQYVEDGRVVSEPLALCLGHHVKKGDLLVQLDDTEHRLAWEAAKADLELARKQRESLLAWKRVEEIRQLEAHLEEAQATLDWAKAELARCEKLREDRVMSASEYEAVVKSTRMAEAAVRRAQAAVELAKAGPTPEEIAVADAHVAAAEAEVKQRKEDLDRTTIHAPYDAVIADRYVDVGDRVQPMPRVEIMQILDPRVLFAEVDVPERFQGRVGLFDPAQTADESRQVWVDADCLEERIPGRVDLINGKIDPATRTFRVRVTIDNRQGLLKPGGFVHVLLPVRSASDVLVVPVEAVTMDEGRHAVFVCQEGRVHRRDVTLGLRSRRLCEVQSGLSAGEQVVVGGTSLLADGLAVRPRRDASSPGAQPGDSLSARSSAGDNPRRAPLASVSSEGAP